MVRKKKDRLPPGADERDRAKFQKAQSYMVLLDDKVGLQEYPLPEAVRHLRREDHGLHERYRWITPGGLTGVCGHGSRNGPGSPN